MTRIFSNEIKESEIGLLIISESASLPWHQIAVESARKQWVNEECNLDPKSWIKWLEYYWTKKCIYNIQYIILRLHKSFIFKNNLAFW